MQWRAAENPFIMMRHDYTPVTYTGELRALVRWEISEIGRKEQLGSVNGNVRQV